MLTGHRSVQRLHPMQASVTKRGFFSTVSVNFPGDRLASFTSAYVRRSMPGWLYTSFIFGDRVHIAQSSVGNVFTERAMFPPIVGLFSIRVTLCPRFASRIDAWIPEMPPPITATPGWIGAVFTSRGRSLRTFSTCPFTIRIAFAVAFWGSWRCAYEHCSRMFAISRRYGFIPASSAFERNSSSYIFGVQHATTTPSRPFSLISRWRRSWPSFEHMKRKSVARTTSSCAPANSRTAFTSTTSEMFPPQWQMKTPTFRFVPGSLTP